MKRMSKIQINIDNKYIGTRLDKVIPEILAGEFGEELDVSFLSRSLAQDFIPSGVYVNGKPVKPSYILARGDRVEVDLEDLKTRLDTKKFNITGETEIKPQVGDLKILFEDEEVLILNKKAGVVVQPGVGNRENTLVNHVKGYLVGKGEFNDEIKMAGLVHRIDKEVSGAIVFAKTPESQNQLRRLFKERKVKKFYLAIAEKYVTNQDNINIEEGKWYNIRGYIQRDPKNRTRMRFLSYKDKNGTRMRGIPKDARSAETNIYFINESEILINIVTGRTHQIRAVLKSLGYHINGDKFYGSSKVSKSGSGIDLQSIFLSFNLDNNDYSCKVSNTIGDNQWCDLANIINLLGAEI